MKNLLQQMKGTKQANGDDDRWLVAVPALVADNNDPERRHRVKVRIPSIDEEQVFDEWCDQMGVYVGGNGFGSFFLPPIGSEVRVFGMLGQKYNLAYLCVYNEDYIVPPDFQSEAVCGFRTPGDYKQITELDYQLRAGRARIETDASVEIIAPGGIFLNGKRT